MITGLSYFTDLVEELDQAISGAKYGDYIMEGGASVGKAPLHHTYLPVTLPTPYHITLPGYSDEVDHLRERMKENDIKMTRLVESLRELHGLTRLTVAPHKSYVRVLEVTKSHASKAEKCKDLFK